MRAPCHAAPPATAPRACADMAPEAVLLVTLEDGTEVAVRNDLRRVTTYVLIEQGRWFEHEWDLLRRVATPGATVFDIGANHGVYALALARRVGPSGRVVAFEPGADPASLLARAAAEAGLSWLELREHAIGDRDGGLSLIAEGGCEEARVTDSGAGGAEIDCRRLDTVWQELGRPDPCILKIDVEGAEALVFEGARELLDATSPLVMFEISGDRRRAIDLCRRLAGFGFSPWRYLPDLGLLVPAEPGNCSSFQLNLVALGSDRAAALAAAGLLVPREEEAEEPMTIEAALDAAFELLADSGSIPAPGRFARAGKALRRIESHLEEVPEAPAYPYRALAYRLSMALGEPERGARHLGAVQAAIRRQPVTTPPPMAMSPWLDHVPPGRELAAWIQIDLFDRMLCAHNWSSRFLPTEILGLLEELRGNPFFPPHLERRRQLRRTLRGLQPALEPGPATAALRPLPGAAGGDRQWLIPRATSAKLRPQ